VVTTCVNNILSVLLKQSRYTLTFQITNYVSVCILLLELMRCHGGKCALILPDDFIDMKWWLLVWRQLSIDVFKNYTIKCTKRKIKAGNFYVNILRISDFRRYQSEYDLFVQHMGERVSNISESTPYLHVVAHELCANIDHLDVKFNNTVYTNTNFKVHDGVCAYTIEKIIHSKVYDDYSVNLEKILQICPLFLYNTNRMLSCTKVDMIMLHVSKLLNSGNTQCVLVTSSSELLQFVGKLIQTKYSNRYVNVRTLETLPLVQSLESHVFMMKSKMNSSITIMNDNTALIAYVCNFATHVLLLDPYIDKQTISTLKHSLIDVTLLRVIFPSNSDDASQFDVFPCSKKWLHNNSNFLFFDFGCSQFLFAAHNYFFDCTGISLNVLLQHSSCLFKIESSDAIELPDVMALDFGLLRNVCAIVSDEICNTTVVLDMHDKSVNNILCIWSNKMVNRYDSCSISTLATFLICKAILEYLDVYILKVNINANTIIMQYKVEKTGCTGVLSSVVLTELAPPSSGLQLNLPNMNDCMLDFPMECECASC